MDLQRYRDLILATLARADIPLHQAEPLFYQAFRLLMARYPVDGIGVEGQVIAAGRN